jgi:hypothetical protein
LLALDHFFKTNYMKKIVLFFLLTSSFSLFSQTDIVDYLEGRKFQNSRTGLIVSYGYISHLNTSGMTFRNSYGDKFYFMNCSIEKSSDERFAIFTDCMNVETGGGVGKIVAYRNKLVIIASDGEMVYELIN